METALVFMALFPWCTPPTVIAISIAVGCTLSFFEEAKGITEEVKRG
jgi:hypothetical protein